MAKAKYVVSPHGAIHIDKQDWDETPGAATKVYPGDVVELDSKMAKHFVTHGRLHPHIPDDDELEDDDPTGVRKVPAVRRKPDEVRGQARPAPVIAQTVPMDEDPNDFLPPEPEADMEEAAPPPKPKRKAKAEPNATGDDTSGSVRKTRRRTRQRDT